MATKPEEPFLTRTWDYITDTQIWRSIFRHGAPSTNRNRALAVMTNVFLHLHPVKIRKSGIRLKFTWCMGGLTFFLFLVETFTGLLLMFYYRPTVAYAYMDIIDLAEQVPLGIMREIHRWGAHAMVITRVAAHVPRVHDRLLQAAPRVQLERGRDPARADPAPVLHRLPAALGPARDLGHHRGLQHGPGHARSSDTKGQGAQLLRLGDVPMVHAGSDARFALLGGRFVGEGALLRFYVLHCVGHPARRRHPDGRPLLAGAQGRRHLGPTVREAA